MLKKVILGLVLHIMVVPMAFAQGTSIAVVDMQRVVEESTAAKAIRDKIKAKRDTYQAQITKREEALREADQKLAKQHSILSPEAFEEKRKEQKNKFIDLQKDLQELRTKLATANTQSLEEVQRVVLEIAISLSREKGFQMVIPKSQILFAEKSLDITSEVIASLNKKLPSVKVKID